jgi:dTDP-4-dehydrorhamnose reductase
MHLRCSIIGRELKTKISLYDWFLNMPINSSVRGFTNHFWNGLTTTSFARIAAGIIRSDNFVPGVHHVIPSDSLSKFQLLNVIAEYNQRFDLTIDPFDTEVPVDRRLKTKYQNFNSLLWSQAGYKEVPKIEDMIAEIAVQNELEPS